MSLIASTTVKQLPKLYVYEHCPFCVRARSIFGLKKVEHELVFLASHDVNTPVGLVGKKTAPILQLASGNAFPESLDIVRYVDEHFGGPKLLKEASGREDLKKWNQQVLMPLFSLVLPRVPTLPLPEFAQRASRDTSLEELEGIIFSESAVNANGLSYDDIELFGTLRGLTLVKGIAWPAKVRAYVDHMAAAADVPLLSAMADA